MATPSFIDQYETPVYHDFKVLIVCALELEAHAVTALLDETYNGVAQHEHDTNTYVFGRLGDHKVVIAHMPKMGGNMANRISSRVRFSFPRIDLCLVVGICGAVPTYDKDGRTKSIQAGDVIVSTGIVHYQVGRQYSHGFEIRVDDPNAPDGRPRDSMITFLQKIKEPKLLQIIQERAAFNSKDYEDSRYNSKYERPPELGHESPSLHFGLFASGEAVYKSIFHRDQLARSANVIGFEMEGFGVWPNFSALIIKGVSDFADHEKDKKTQRYAAATAATYAKAILRAWKLSRDENALIVQNTHMKAQIKSTVLNGDLDHALVQAKGITDDILSRLSSFDHMQFHRHIASERMTGTCEWILANDHFLRWYGLDSHVHWDEPKGKNVLWLHGVIGAGKTVCMSRIIDHLRKGIAGDNIVHATLGCRNRLVFFYFDSSRPVSSNAQALLESLIKQMIHNISRTDQQVPDHIRETLEKLCSPQQLGRRDIDVLATLFTDLYTLSSGTIYLIDGLDEMPEHDIRLILLLLSTRDVRVESKFLISSRTVLGNNLNLPGILERPSQIYMANIENQPDIERYIEHKFTENSLHMRNLTKDESLILKLKSALKSAARGSFVWLAAQIGYLWQFCR